MNLDLEKIKPTSIALLVMVFFVTVIPGALFLFLFKQEIFLQLDSFKLILLSIGITLPFFIFNTLLYVIWEGGLGESTQSNGFQIGVLSGSMITIPVVYIPLFLNLFLNLGGRTILISMLGIEVLIIIGAIFVEN